MQQQGWMSCIQISSEGMETKQGVFEEILHWNCIQCNLGVEGEERETDRQREIMRTLYQQKKYLRRMDFQQSKKLPTLCFVYLEK